MAVSLVFVTAMSSVSLWFPKKTPSKCHPTDQIATYYSILYALVVFLKYSGKVRDDSFSTHAKFSEKLTFLTPWYAKVSVRIRGWEMVVFEKFCVRTKWMIPNPLLPG